MRNREGTYFHRQELTLGQWPNI